METQRTGAKHLQTLAGEEGLGVPHSESISEDKDLGLGPRSEHESLSASRSWGSPHCHCGAWERLLVLSALLQELGQCLPSRWISQTRDAEKDQSLPSPCLSKMELEGSIRRRDWINPRGRTSQSQQHIVGTPGLFFHD